MAKLPLYSPMLSVREPEKAALWSEDGNNADSRPAPTRKTSSRVVDFLSSEVFRTILRTPTTLHQLVRYSKLHHCGETMQFLEKVDAYHTLIKAVKESTSQIQRDFIANDAADQVNLSHSVLAKTTRSLQSAIASWLPELGSVFDEAESEITKLVQYDLYPRFVQHQLSLSAGQALGQDRTRYEGLGDCFVLTDPSLADNPITYASDGFVDVTGYNRNEIIPRNCRFLQCRQTDRNAVKNIKLAVTEKREYVELLLNEKKSGEPFWNLLYSAPLFDKQGKVVFFLGGQVNCSTTIHNSDDIVRILSLSDGEATDRMSTLPSEPTDAQPSRASRFFTNFKLRRTTSSNLQKQGMENSLLDRIGKMNLQTQMDAFHSAYSKFLIINYPSMTIEFYSRGIIQPLYSAESDPSELEVIGVDIFKFLNTHAAGGLRKDFRPKVKSALKAGSSISLEAELHNRRRSPGTFKSLIHWTPLKDESGKSRYVVLALGSLVGG